MYRIPTKPLVPGRLRPWGCRGQSVCFSVQALEKCRSHHDLIRKSHNLRNRADVSINICHTRVNVAGVFELIVDPYMNSLSVRIDVIASFFSS